MKYFQTDDRDDYFDSMSKNRIKPKVLGIDLIDPNGKKIFNCVGRPKVKKYAVKTHGGEGWIRKNLKPFLESKGYTYTTIKEKLTTKED